MQKVPGERYVYKFLPDAMASQTIGQFNHFAADPSAISQSKTGDQCFLCINFTFCDTNSLKAQRIFGFKNVLILTHTASMYYF